MKITKQNLMQFAFILMILFLGYLFIQIDSLNNQTYKCEEKIIENIIEIENDFDYSEINKRFDRLELGLPEFTKRINSLNKSINNLELMVKDYHPKDKIRTELIGGFN